ncbi:MAG: carbohydrate-binding family 9-like protein [Armatimonadota bacterium]
MRYLVPVLLCLSMLGLTALGQARDPQPGKILILPYGKTSARVDGFVTTRNTPAGQRTAVQVSWDRDGLTVQFDCADNDVQAKARPRDDAEMWKDDGVELFLDLGHTHDDLSGWLHVIVSANGDVYDESDPMTGYFGSGEPMGGDRSVDLKGLKTHVERTAAGWRARLSLPWSDIGVTPKAGDVWGFNVTRTDQPAGDYTCFSPTWGPFHTMSQWGHLVFARGAAGQAEIERKIAARHDEEKSKRLREVAMKRCMAAMEPLGQTWVEIDGTTYGAKPDARGPLGGGAGYAAMVAKGDYQVSTLDGLLDALKQAKAGQTIFIDGKAEIDCTVRTYIEGLVLEIPAGVTLASDRGQHGSPGALIFSDTFKTSPLISCLGPDVRITGLRLRGPDPEPRFDLHQTSAKLGAAKGSPEGFDHEYYYKFPTSDGIRVEFAGLEVDNCELAGWSHAAIYLVKGERHHVHHNYIHHNQRNGLGYGVSHGYHPVESLIEMNVFNANRHSIAATGAPGNTYEACHNVELGQSLSHCFDMHGGADRKDGTDIAGSAIRVHHNTFRSFEKPLRIRGVPQQEAVVEYNWFLHHAPDDPDRTPVSSGGNTRVENNAYKARDPRVLDAKAVAP